MGLDFIRVATPSFNRVLDRRLVEMHSPNLFTHDMPIVSRTACADVCGGAKVTAGAAVAPRAVAPPRRRDGGSGGQGSLL